MTIQDQETGDSRTPRRAPRRHPLAEAGWLLITLLVTSAAAGRVLGLSEMRLNVPLSGSGDTNLALSTVTTIIEKGWFLHTDRLGAPLGQHLYDYAAPGDLLNMLELRFLALFSSDTGVVINSFYLLSFVLASASAFWALGRLAVSLPVAAACAVLFSCLPFHFLRGEEGHLFLSNYWVVPLACFLVLRQLGPTPLLDLSRGASPWRDRAMRRSMLAALAICMAAGSTGIYYAAFTVILLTITGAVRAIGERRLASLVAAVLLSGVVVGVVVVSALPSILYARAHGANELVAQRAYAETEFFGLKIVNLVLPVGGHRLDALSRLRAEAGESPVPGEGSDTLGLLAATGFIALLALALARLTTGSLRRSSLTDTAGGLAATLLAAVLVATVGGFSAVLAAFGFTSLRGWNRISVVIAFLSIAAVGLGADRLIGVAARFTGRWTDAGRVGLAGVLAIGGVWDMTTPAMRPDHRSLHESWHSRDDFVRGVERTLGRDAEVFQLPYAPFPEIPPIVDMKDYEHFHGYIHSKTLRWSYGAVKGRPEAQWQAAVSMEPLPQMVESLAVVGFEAIWIDRLGYQDQARDLEAQLAAILGAPPALSTPDERFVVFDLRQTQARLRSSQPPERLAARREAILRPTVVEWGEGFFQEEHSEETVWRWAGERASLTLVNPGKTTRESVLRFGLAGAHGASNLEVAWPTGSRHFTVAAERQDAEVLVTLPPGRTVLTFVSDAPPDTPPGDSRDLRFRILDFAVVDVAR